MWSPRNVCMSLATQGNLSFPPSVPHALYLPSRSPLFSPNTRSHEAQTCEIETFAQALVRQVLVSRGRRLLFVALCLQSSHANSNPYFISSHCVYGRPDARPYGSKGEVMR
jgi:hypothetical protein